MPLTGIYFLPEPPSSTIPTPTYQTLTDRIVKRFDPSVLPARWTLEYRVLRETPSSVNSVGSGAGAPDGRGGGSLPSTTPPLRHLQILHLSHHPGRSFINITRPHSSRPSQATATSSSTTTGAVAGQPASTAGNTSSNGTSGQPSQENNDEDTSSMILIPHAQQTDDLIQLLRTRMGPLWTSRQSMFVSNGVGFEVEDLKIRIGDLIAQGLGPASGGAGASGGGAGGAAGASGPAQQLARGVIVEVTWSGDMAGDDGAMDGINGMRTEETNGKAIPSDSSQANQESTTAMDVDRNSPARDPTSTAKEEGDNQKSNGPGSEQLIKSGEQVLQAFWQRLGTEPGKAYLDWSPSAPDMDGAKRMGLARRYCEMLLL